MAKTKDTKVTYAVYLLDVYAGESGERGDWDENQRTFLGDMSFETSEKTIEKDLLNALAKFEIKDVLGIPRGTALNTTDRRRVYVELADDFESRFGDVYEVGEVKGLRPVYRLLFKKEEALS